MFENDSDIVRNLLDTLRNVLALGVEDFPYHIELTSAGYNLSRAKVSEECLWKVFLNQTLKARHDVAHGVSQYQKSFYKCVSFIKKRNLGSDSKKEN